MQQEETPHKAGATTPSLEDAALFFHQYPRPGKLEIQATKPLGNQRDLALAYNQVWWDRGTSTGRTSLIVDPPNGRLPSLTPEAEGRQAEQREYRRVHPYDSWEDRPLQERCMTYQRAPPVPSGYNNTYHILQTPGYVAIFNEMIHICLFTWFPI